MNKQTIFQGPYWRRYSNVSASGLLTDLTGQNVQLSSLPSYTLRLESNDLAMGTLNYRVMSVPQSADAGRTPGGQLPGTHTTDMFSTVTTATLKKGTVVRITASPANTRYVWDHFENAAGQRIASNTGQVDVTINQNTTVRAVFRERNEQQYVTLNVSYNHAQGTVTATPALTNDSVTVNVGHAVVLTATPKTGYKFKQWRNVLNGGGTNHTVTTEPVHTERMVTGSKTIYADFERLPDTPVNPDNPTTKTITVKWDNEKGKVTANSSAISNGKNFFTLSANVGDTITIKATPKSAYHFGMWTGSPVNGSTDEQVSFAVNGDYTIYANFVANSDDPGENPGGGGNGGGGGNDPADPGTGTSAGTGKVMAFVRKWWWALLIGAYLIYEETKKGGRK